MGRRHGKKTWNVKYKQQHQHRTSQRSLNIQKPCQKEKRVLPIGLHIVYIGRSEGETTSYTPPPQDWKNASTPWEKSLWFREKTLSTWWFWPKVKRSIWGLLNFFTIWKKILGFSIHSRSVEVFKLQNPPQYSPYPSDGLPKKTSAQWNILADRRHKALLFVPPWLSR